MNEKLNDYTCGRLSTDEVEITLNMLGLATSSLATVSCLGSVPLQQLGFLLLHCINCWLSEFREIFLCLLLHITHTRIAHHASHVREAMNAGQWKCKIPATAVAALGRVEGAFTSDRCCELRGNRTDSVFLACGGKKLTNACL
jgi:hypothetical protein